VYTCACAAAAMDVVWKARVGIRIAAGH